MWHSNTIQTVKLIVINTTKVSEHLRDVGLLSRISKRREIFKFKENTRENEKYRVERKNVVGGNIIYKRRESDLIRRQ